MLQVFQFGEVLRERDYILVETRHPLSHITEASEVTNGHLHVIQGHQHGLNNRGLPCKPQPSTVGTSFVEAEEWIEVVPGREGSNFVEDRIILDFLVGLVTSHADTMVQCRVLRCLISRLRSPRVHVNTASLETLQLEVGFMLRVPCGKAVITSLAVEKNHVAENTLAIQHATM